MAYVSAASMCQSTVTFNGTIDASVGRLGTLTLPVSKYDESGAASNDSVLPQAIYNSASNVQRVKSNFLASTECRHGAHGWLLASALAACRAWQLVFNHWASY